MTATPTPGSLEDLYDCLAEALDRVGEAQTPLFLVKLALLQAEALGLDVARFREQVAIAAADL
jgi:hypothetical protein